MNPVIIKRRLSRSGPHRICTSDGKEYGVPPPEFVLVGRNIVVIEDEHDVLDVLDPIHIVAIRSEAKQPAPRG
ncbi:MAG TPA: hypothetical protein PKE47_04485 [Verrucomicrobiota bacterium]|nr:hypothetical protein [Verrucomicrobiota bacterium]